MFRVLFAQVRMQIGVRVFVEAAATVARIGATMLLLWLGWATEAVSLSLAQVHTPLGLLYLTMLPSSPGLTNVTWANLQQLMLALSCFWVQTRMIMLDIIAAVQRDWSKILGLR